VGETRSTSTGQRARSGWASPLLAGEVYESKTEPLKHGQGNSRTVEEEGCLNYYQSGFEQHAVLKGSLVRAFRRFTGPTRSQL